MKKILFTLLALAVTVMPTFAAGEPAPDMKPDMKHMMQQHPEMKQMMQNPQHLLAMAYHKNLVSFAMTLKKVAQQGETVPRDFARSAITEMRRSADQMEIYHEAALKGMPADQQAKRAEIAKMMSAHLAEMRAQLAQLDDLAKGDRVDSKEILKHLQIILKGCEGMRHAGMHGEGMHGKGMDCGCMHGKGKHGDCGCRHGEGEQGDCGCRHGEGEQGKGMHGDCMHGMGGKKMDGAGGEGWQEMMQQRHKMMEAMKAQDAEISKLVDTMNRAPKDQKQAIMADILTRMVKQRVAMDEQLEKLQEHMKHQRPMGAGKHCQEGPGSDSDEAYDSDSDDMNSDMDSDADNDDGDMDMKGMNMED